MSDLREKIAELYDSKFTHRNKEIALSFADEVISLLPSLTDWETVEDNCHHVHLDNETCDCGITTTPLQFEDVDWSELLRCAQYWSNFKLVTKAGARRWREAHGCGILRVGIIGKSRRLTLPRIMRKSRR